MPLPVSLSLFEGQAAAAPKALFSIGFQYDFSFEKKPNNEDLKVSNVNLLDPSVHSFP